MKYSTFALLSVVGSAVAGGVTSKVSPPSSAPSGCSASYDGLFQVTVEKVTVAKKRDLSALRRRDACPSDGTLVVGLTDGVLTDSQGRTGYIASNFQFQFDGPPQAGAIYTAGFSACGNGSLALGGSAVWYECLSGNFYNLYDQSWAAQCSPVEIAIISCGDPPSASESPDGQVVGTTVVATTIVVPLSDGQPQVLTTTVPVPLCQISDGQLQVKTTPCASITTTVKATSTPVPVSQYSDGQIQVTPVGSVSTVVGTTPPVTGTVTGTVVPPPISPSTVAVTTPKTTVVGSNSTTLKTTGTPSTSVSSASSAASSSAATTAPASGGAGHVEMSSVSALVIGIVGAVFFL